MVAYVVFIREKSTNQVELDTYAQKAPAAAEGHSVSFLTLYGKHEVLEGPTMEGAAIARLAVDAPLAEVDWPKVYGSTAEGYTDYPALRAVPG